MSEELEKTVLRKFDVVSKLGKGVSAIWLVNLHEILSETLRECPQDFRPAKPCDPRTKMSAPAIDYTCPFEMEIMTNYFREIVLR